MALERDRLKLQPMPAMTTRGGGFDRRLDALLPRVRITELLVEVAERTWFLSAFRDLRSARSMTTRTRSSPPFSLMDRIGLESAWPTPATG